MMIAIANRKSASAHSPADDLRDLAESLIVDGPRFARSRVRYQKRSFRLTPATRQKLAQLFESFEETGDQAETLAKLTRLLKAYRLAIRRSATLGKTVQYRLLVRPDKRVSIDIIETIPSNPTSSDATQIDPVAANPVPDLETALREARERGKKTAAEILSAQDMLTSEEFAELLGITRMSVHEKRKRNEVLALEGAKRGFKFPRWQIGSDGKPLKGLADIVEKFDGRHWAVYRFLIQHHPELNGRTGLEALEAGDDELAIDAVNAQLSGTFS